MAIIGLWQNGRRIAAGLAAMAGAVGVLYGLDKDKRRALASWTTNFTPSVRWDNNWDKCEPESLVKPTRGSGDTEDKLAKLDFMKSKANRHLILIRHGQYNLNGETDKQCYLTNLGKEQADLTGKRLKELGLPYTALIHSTMTRAMETAGIISKHLPAIPIQECAIIHEGAPIPPEPPVGHWRAEMKQFYQDGARIEAAFRQYFHRAHNNQSTDSYEIIVCHANVIRYFVCRALQFPPEAWLRFSLHNASLTWITIRPNGRVILRTLGDSGHIPAEKLSVS